MPRARRRGAELTATLERRRAGSTRWSTRIAVPPTTHEVRDAAVRRHTPADAAQRAAAGSPDAAAVEGVASNYAIRHFARSIIARPTSGCRPGRWRGNADSYTAFFTECFVDEMAARAGTDRAVLSHGDARATSPLLARCLLTATSLGGWEGGVATALRKGSPVTFDARQPHRADGDGAAGRPNGLQVEQLVAVVDAGRLVNPAVARQQVEGGLVFGLAAAVGATTDYEGRRRDRAQIRPARACPDLSQSAADPGGIHRQRPRSGRAGRDRRCPSSRPRSRTRWPPRPVAASAALPLSAEPL
jgi:isoquinoline 1-oxidoreductase beta subunit